MSGETKGPQVAFVRQMPGEPTTFQVASKSEPGTWHHVCLKAHNGNGECSCKRWATVCWKRIKETGNLPPSHRCRHLRASRELYCSKKIAEEPAYE